MVVGALVAIFLLAPGSAEVRHTFFDPHDMWQSFIGNPKAGYYSVGAAIWLNIRMFLVAEVLILAFSLVIALVRQSTGPVLFPLRVLGVIYVDFFRGVPLLLVILAIGFGVPALNLPVVSHQPLPVYGVDGAGPVLLRLRLRGVPGRAELGPPQPGGGRALARACHNRRRCGT